LEYYLAWLIKQVSFSSENTCLNKFGVKNPMQSEKIKEKSKQSCLDKYGETNFAKTPRGRALSRKNYIKMIEIQKLNGEPLMPCIGTEERTCLNVLQLLTFNTIIRNDSSFRYNIGFFPDGHILELKLFIEFDERHHFIDEYKTYIQKDIDRELILASLGYIIFRISEKQWKTNKEQVIDNFKLLIEELQRKDTLYA
jgi:hypothetical protein